MKNYWIDILFRPRVTISKIIQEDVSYGKRILPFFSGLSLSGVIINPDASQDVTFDPLALLIISIVIAWPLGWCSYKICGWIGTFIAEKIKVPTTREVIDALILWTGYIYFFPILLKIALTLSAESTGFSVIQMFADMGLYYGALALTAYALVISIILAKDTLKTDWIKTALFILLYSTIVSALLFAFIFVVTIAIASWSLFAINFLT